MASRFVQQAEIRAAADDDGGHPIMDSEHGRVDARNEGGGGGEEKGKFTPPFVGMAKLGTKYVSLLRRQRQIAAIYLAGQSGSDEIMVRWSIFQEWGEGGDVGNWISYKNATLVW